MFKRGFSAWTIACSVSLAGLLFSPYVYAQPLPNIKEKLLPSTKELNNENQDEQIVSDCIFLDGRCLFKVTASKSELSTKIESIQNKLDEISFIYFKNLAGNLKVQKVEEIEQEKDKLSKVHNIYIFLGEQKIRLMKVTENDAKLEEIDINTKAEQIVKQLKEGLKKAKEERQIQFLIQQGRIAAGIFGVMILVSLTIIYFKRFLKQRQAQETYTDASDYEQIWRQLVQSQQLNLRAVQRLLLQLALVAVWAGGSLFILGLFPYTRTLQLFIVTTVKIPLRLVVVGLATYVIIRLSYASIERFNSVIASNSTIVAEPNRRLQLRITTISTVTKSIVTISCIVIGFLVALTSIGVNIAPLLAGAGIVGLAISFGSQNLIKDAINGFFIILEDQFAVGDVISVGEVNGLVENMNLRITQLRDAEGRLITIPNSEIRIVANLSSSWSRADLNIPVAYDSDVDKAIELFTQVADEMSDDQNWKDKILESPQVLGVENFGDRGVIIRVWIKTKPLKQWEVSREFRRRIKISCDRAGIHIPQQEILFKQQS